MMYVAKCYVSIAGRVLRPGEAFEAETEDAKISRLLRMNAITAVKPSFAPAPAKQDQNGENDDEDCRENHRAQMENLGYDASGNPLDSDAEELVTEEEPVTEEESFEEDCDEEAPEIDVMDGIISGDEQEAATVEESPKKTKGRKKA